MADRQNKYLSVARVLSGKTLDDGTVYSPSLALGSSKNKDPKYDVDVKITVTNPHTGEVLHEQVNGFLNFFEPMFKSEEAKAKSSTLYNVSVKRS